MLEFPHIHHTGAVIAKAPESGRLLFRVLESH